MHTRPFFLVAIGALLAILALLAAYLFACEDDWCFHFEWQRVRSVQSFEDCAARGYPVMESFPRQCRTPDGRTFVEEIVGENDEDEVQTGNITVEEPAEDDLVSESFTIRGKARVFENALSYRVKDQEGNIIVEGHTTALSPDIGLFGPYEVAIDLPEGVEREGTVEVFNYSARDGSEENMVRIPIRF